ncbi:MAG: phosphatidate cytidylyltransferase [Chloroflexota bacterium]
MLSERVLVAVAFLPVGFAAFIMGGWLFTLFALAVVVMAAREYVNLFEPLGFKASAWIVLPGVVVLVGSRYIGGFSNAPLALSLIVLATMAYHLVAYERGRENAATDFAISISGIVYIGWLGAYFVSLRALPDGMWWLFLVLPCIWLADSAAYFVGIRFGRHKLAPRLSPKKTWEGYFGGVIGGTLSGMLIGLIIGWLAPPWTVIDFWSGGVIGFLMGVLPTLGDLGESMIKRQVNVKDSGDIIPGHGGFFDRIDSWLWAGVIAYYAILWFF